MIYPEIIDIATMSEALSEKDSLATRGLVFDISPYTVQDGPGIRTTVFLKGCPVRCWWCSNPESQKAKPQVLYAPSLCAHCGRCVEVCPRDAISMGDNGFVETNQELCIGCGECATVCPQQARTLKGTSMTVGEVVKRVMRDAVFYRTSGGGVTVSGGEPLLQPVFTRELFRQFKEEGLRTAIETTGYAKWDVVEPIAENVDLFLYDIKHMDPGCHKHYTGVDNALIQQNVRRIAAKGNELIIRVPLIPGVNNSEQNLRATAELAVELGGVQVDLMPYHKFGLSKYMSLGMEYRMGDTAALKEWEVEAAKTLVESYGIPTQIV